MHFPLSGDWREETTDDHAWVRANSVRGLSGKKAKGGGAKGGVAKEKAKGSAKGGGWGGMGTPCTGTPGKQSVPRAGTLVEVEVEADGVIEWRKAHVLYSWANRGEFLACVCFPDGTPDEAFIEKYERAAEGKEWRWLNSKRG